MLFRHLISSYYWARSTYLFYNGEYSKALSRYNEFCTLVEQKKKHIAYHATLLVLLMRSSEARYLFEDVISKPNISLEDEYVDLYSQLYIYIIDHQEINKATLDKLLSINIGSSIRRILAPPIL